MRNAFFRDDASIEEFLDRFDELKAEAGFRGGLESLDAMNVDRAEEAARSLQEGTGADIPRGLEAIIRRFERPAYFVRDDSFDTEGTPSSSEAVDAEVNEARAVLEAAIPSVGRLDLRNHRKAYVGTAWVVRPDVVVTNAHVAREFAHADGGAFAYDTNFQGRKVRAYLDRYREYRTGNESVFRLREVLWIAGSGEPDVAFLRVDRVDDDQNALPAPIDLATDDEFAALDPEAWLAVVGYPAHSDFNDRQDQQRIFQGVFNVKRLQPGRLMATPPDGTFHHDATTLGGNSGSTVVDLESGKAVGLHFGGLESDSNWAVAAPAVQRLLQEHVG